MTSLSAVDTLDNTLGALFNGVIVGAALWGVGSLQLYIYFYKFPKDRLLLKSTVLAAWIFDSVHQALISHIIYYYLVQHFFDPAALEHYVWSQNYQPLFEALTGFIVQSFFVYRIFTLSKGSYILTAIPSLLVIAKLACSLSYVGQGSRLTTTTQFVHDLRPISEAINGVTAAGDITITILLCWLLYHSRTSISRTNYVINRLILYTVNTGALTSICAIITLILAHTMPTNLIYGPLYYIIARLYVNSMLATLNARSALQSKLGDVVTLSNIPASKAELPVTAGNHFVAFTPSNGKPTASLEFTTDGENNIQSFLP
ncbi:hypothetical protein GYMLUDRAFT_251289 [Collybiopsis luxurians FD-317 M1]|uniref:DUF6534 domain-containing protein n=1 Tax=Collybiopsis luxurians FD-317 M1 TaxID=944289 RepID=A0A0D0C3E6_9AGAR|nr:hypothetical protein GYMLUDRAFT_251289 [Collybiopsis luxurians FD-317 M1]